MLLNHLLFCLLCVVFALTARGQLLFDHGKKWELQSKQSLTFVSANFDSDGGGYDKLPAHHLYRALHVSPQLRLGFDGLGVRAGFLYGYSMSEDGSNQRLNGAIDHFSMGLDYALFSKHLLVVPRIVYGLAHFKNNLNDDIVAVGDGVSSIEAGLEIRAKSWHMPMIFDVSYRSRDLLSKTLNFSASAQIPFQRSALFGGLRGYTTIVQETPSSTLTRSTWFCRANGCAAIAQAINPSVLQVVAGYDHNNWGIELSHAINGIRVAQETGFSFYIKLESDNPSTSAASSQTKTNDPIFIEDTTTSVSEEIFQAPKVINPVAPAKRESPQKTLDQIEMQLELRQKKKNKKKKAKGTL